jgi:hypothetical protein
LKYHYLKGQVYYDEYRQVKGTPYLIDEWLTGDIYLDNGKELKVVMFKLDVYAHRILVYHENLKRLVIPEKDHITGFTFHEKGRAKNYIKIFGVNAKAKVFDGCYFEVLTEGEVSFFKLDYKDVLSLKEAEKKYIEEFLDEISYYLLKDGEYKQVRLHKLSLLKKFPEFKVQIRKYIRKNNLKVRKENDFVAAITYINEILELLANE